MTSHRQAHPITGSNYKNASDECDGVIHERGLSQGSLGFNRASVLLEDDCADFSNIVGLTQIRFPKGGIQGKFEEIRRVLEREWILVDGAPNSSVGNSQSSPTTAETSIGSGAVKYLMSLNRPRNSDGIPFSFLDTQLNRESEEFRELAEELLENAILRIAQDTFVLMSKGHRFADQLWQSHIPRAILKSQDDPWNYLQIEQLAKLANLDDGVNEAIELQRHLAATSKRGFIEPVRGDGAIVAVRITNDGRTDVLHHADWEFGAIP